MNKQHLLNIIDKYYLNKTVEKVCWVIQNNELNINFFSPNKNMVGVLSTPITLPNTEIGIFNTGQLYSLINVTEGEIDISIDLKKNIPVKLNINDKIFNLSYSLSDTMLIERIKSVKEPPQPITSLDFTSEHINMFLKSKKALSESTVFSLELMSNTMLFTVGDSSNYANKITFEIPCEFVLGGDSMSFNSDLFKEILVANKTAKNTLHVFEEGMIKFESEESNIKTTYYLVKI